MGSFYRGKQDRVIVVGTFILPKDLISHDLGLMTPISVEPLEGVRNSHFPLAPGVEEVKASFPNLHKGWGPG